MVMWPYDIAMTHDRPQTHSSFHIVAWPTASRFADWSKCCRVTFIIIEWCTCRRSTVVTLQCRMVMCTSSNVCMQLTTNLLYEMHALGRLNAIGVVHKMRNVELTADNCYVFQSVYINAISNTQSILPVNNPPKYLVDSIATNHCILTRLQHNMLSFVLNLLLEKHCD